jgi:hypothetical protein
MDSTTSRIRRRATAAVTTALAAHVNHNNRGQVVGF